MKKGESSPSTGGRKHGKSRKARGDAQAGARGRVERSARGGTPGGTVDNQKTARDDA
jgi:hypothetical protein